MASRASLVGRVTRALVREDIDPDDMAGWIDSATARLNQELRINDMLVRASLPLTSANPQTPPDFIAVKTLRLTGSAQFGTPKGPLIYATPEHIAAMASRWPHCYPGYYASFGRELEVAPFRAASGVNLDLWYYAALNDLAADADTNLALEKYPDLYLNAVCIYGHRFYLEMDQALMRDGLVTAEIQRLNDRKDAEKYGDGPLMMQPAPAIGRRFR